MKSKLLLLKVLMLSTSRANTYRYTADKKVRRKIMLSAVGYVALFLMLLGYGVLTCIGYAQLGIIEQVPLMCALMVSILAFVLTFLKTNGYLFNFKEYDMLMSLPFSPRTIAASRFFYMYLKSLPWYISISLSMMIGYGISVRTSFVVYPVWILLSILLPVIPMAAAAFLGFLVAAVGTRFRMKKAVQTILMFLIVLLCLCSRFFIDASIRNEQIADALSQAAEALNGIAGFYLPARWFAGSVTELSVRSMFTFTGLTLLAAEVVFILLGACYRNINSALTEHTAAGSYRISVMKRHSTLNAIAFKEFNRMLGSVTYMVNGGMGEVLAVLLGVAVLFLGFDRLIELVLQGAPISGQMLRPVIPLIVYFLVGMVATTACSPSLEGKNYWIVSSLPITQKTLYQGKMLFNLYLTLPFMSFAVLCICISARMSVLDTSLCLLLGAALCAFSSAWGCACGIRFMRLDWENEVEVVKQGAALAFYLLPNMIVTMGLIALVVFLGTFMSCTLLLLIQLAAVSILAAVCYHLAVRLAQKQRNL